MRPHDPDFPEEIPAIPDPEPERPASEISDSAAMSEESGDHPSDPAATNPAVPEPRADDQWTELDEAEPNLPPPPVAPTEPDDWERFDRRPDPVSGVRSPRPEAGSRPEPALAPPPSYDHWAEEGMPYQPKELGIIDQFLLVLADGASVWRKLLRWVRLLLPIKFQRRLSDEVLTAIILGLLMLLLAVWNPLGRRSPAVVDRGPDSPVAESNRVEAPSLGDGSSLAAGETSLTAPELSPTVPLPDPSSPDQGLIEAIQTQVSRLSRSYTAGLIESVEVNLPAHILTVNISADWYGLGRSAQDRIAQDIYNQAQGLEFQTLRLRDAEGTIVARNPVVGNTMIVLKRIRATDADLLSATDRSPAMS